jgi:Tfp pilus assembly protein PilN
VRAINLIPVDQRRGAARGSGGKTSVGVYALLGGLGAAVVCVLAFVLLSNSINEKTEKLAELEAQAQGEKQVADALRPYGQFADMQRARHQQISTLTSGRFDWERALRQLSLAIPRNVYLLNVAATGSPDVEIDGGSASGGLQNIRKKNDAPAFVMTGCTYSQHAVARMMIRMRNLDDVTEVHLAKSTRKEDSSAADPTAATPEASQENEDVTDCVGSSRITKFDLLISFGGASTAGAAAAAAAVPPGSAAPIASAQGAAQQGAQATTAAGGTP